MQKKRSTSRNASDKKGSAHQHVPINEEGGWKKKWKDRLPIGLIYPNRYRIGMSNLGFQLVYNLLNSNPDIVAERIFVSETPQRAKSVESGRLLRDFPVLLFSVSFEEDYLHLIRLLIDNDIPPLTTDRDKEVDPLESKVLSQADGGLPLIMAGGVATFINPEPLASFIDCFIIGEAEPVLQKITSLLFRRIHDDNHLIIKEKLLLELARSFSCCYVPKFYSFTYDNNGYLDTITPAYGLPARITKAVLPQPEESAGHSQILTPDTEFSDLYMTELGRGCSRGCRFCAAGFVYRPPRLWSADKIIKALKKRPRVASRIGLLGMEMVSGEDLNTIAEFLVHESCSLSFSSLRADLITPELIELLSSSGLKTSAIAPDGGSERLRRVINKGITEDDILAASEALVRIGVANLKLYFMIGLPTEKDEDMQELVALTRKIKDRILTIGSSTGKMSRLTLSVNCFIPKPWTPFQFYPFANIATLKKRLQYLRKELQTIPNVTMHADKPEKSLFQAVLARGDRRLALALVDIAATGRNWRQVFKRHHLVIEDYAAPAYSHKNLFPWEIIQHGVKKGYLWNEYQKALEGRATAPCDTATCKRCGICHGN